MKIKYISCLALLIIITSCAGNTEKKIKDLDKVFGCDNPHRQLSDIEYKICVDKQRAAGGEPLDMDKLTTDLRDIFNKNSSTIYQSSVNKSLWDASLEIAKNYPLKIADNQGGYIETDWIYSENDFNERCAIKIQIVSLELLSTGVRTNIICQNKKNDTWINSNEEFIEEEKQLTIKILEEAVNISSNLQSIG
jgi:hypothetical protein